MCTYCKAPPHKWERKEPEPVMSQCLYTEAIRSIDAFLCQSRKIGVDVSEYERQCLLMSRATLSDYYHLDYGVRL